MPAILTYALLSIPLIGAYAIFALGISVMYRASRVLNLAHGAMAMLPAYLMYSMVRAHFPMPIALLLAIFAGAALGVGVERVFIRRLRAQGPTAQTVGTVAVTGLLIAIASKVWGSAPQIAPRIFPAGEVSLGRSGIRYGDIGLFLTALVVSFALFTFFKRTQYGLALRAAAQNRRAAALMGVDPDLAAAAAWALGGGLAALGGILLASVTTLDPYNLSLQVLPAFVAALIGGIENLPGALSGAAVAGLSFGLVPYFAGTPVIGNVVGLSGAPQLALALLTLIVMALRGRRLAGAEQTDAGFTAPTSAVKHVSRKRFGRRLPIIAVLLIIWPLIIPYSWLGNSLVTVRYALIAISLVVMTGWVGQISLAQASFVGIAALVTGLVVRGTGIGFPVNMVIAAGAAAAAGVILGVVALRVRGLYLAVATLIFAWMCDAFLFTSPWLGASGGSSTIPAQRLGAPGGVPSFDLTSRKTLYFFMVVVLLLVVFALANLRDTKTGRAFFAVRGSEMAAASLGIDVVRTKLVAFAMSGALAGVAGNLLMIEHRTVVPNQFLFTISLQFLAIAVVGGLGSLGGAIAAGGVFAALSQLFLDVPALSGWLEVVSAMLLVTVLLAYPGGLAAAGSQIGAFAGRIRGLVAKLKPPPRPQPVREESEEEIPVPAAEVEAPRRRRHGVIRERISSFVGPLSRLRPARALGARGAALLAARTRRNALPPTDDWLGRARRGADVSQASGNGSGTPQVEVHTPLLPLNEMMAAANANAPSGNGSEDSNILEVEHVTVRFGGLTAVDDASLAVREGTITGLIGPNGAGKTTLFNAILGLNDPAAGRIVIRGHDATGLPPHLRARLGVARTFQVLQLFNELTVFDNLLVATHLHNSSGVWSNLAASAGTLAAERDARERVGDVLHLLQLDEYRQRSVRGLPFGVLRMVELGRALVTGARLVMLDEPASGLNEAETDKLASVVRGMRSLGVSVLLIEHDVRMVTGICDYVYVLDQGRMISEGTSQEIRNDPAVVAAYLGTPAEPVEAVHA